MHRCHTLPLILASLRNSLLVPGVCAQLCQEAVCFTCLELKEAGCLERGNVSLCFDSLPISRTSVPSDGMFVRSGTGSGIRMPFKTVGACCWHVWCDASPLHAEWNDSKADLLRVMLEASIQRRFPQGLKVHVRSLQSGSCLTELAQRLRAANLSITRAKV